MGFQFAETMSGTVEWDAKPGERLPFRFELTAHAASTRRHLADGKTSVRGLMFAPPIAQGVDLDGVITIRLVGQRIIRYELAFTGDDGKPYELVGQKDIRWLAPKSFTYLPADILDGDHRRIGTCEVHFDLKRDGWRFLRSFRPA